MADLQRKSREVVDLSKVSGMGNGIPRNKCGNDACYCDGSCTQEQARGLGYKSNRGNEVQISDDNVNSKAVGSIRVKVDVDVSDALTGLKAVQREAKKATQSLAELKAEQERISIELDGEEVGKLVEPTVKELQERAVEEAVNSEEGIPDKLRKDILAKFKEDKSIITELERSINRSVSDDIRRSYE